MYLYPFNVNYTYRYIVYYSILGESLRLPTPK